MKLKVNFGNNRICYLKNCRKNQTKNLNRLGILKLKMNLKKVF